MTDVIISPGSLRTNIDVLLESPNPALDLLMIVSIRSLKNFISSSFLPTYYNSMTVLFLHGKLEARQGYFTNLFEQLFSFKNRSAFFHKSSSSLDVISALKTGHYFCVAGI